MARTAIPVTTITPRAWTAVAFVTADSANDYEWTPQAGDILFAFNNTASTPTYTVVRPENVYGRGADYTSPSVAQNTMRVHYWRELTGWVDPSTGKISIDTTSDDMCFAVVRPSPRLGS